MLSECFFFVTLQEFAGFLYIEAVWGFEDFLGYGLETVLNSTFCYKLLSMSTRRWVTSHFMTQLRVQW